MLVMLASACNPTTTFRANNNGEPVSDVFGHGRCDNREDQIARPTELKPGEYYMAVDYLDGCCRVVARGCVNFELPADEGVEFVVPRESIEPEACEGACEDRCVEPRIVVNVDGNCVAGEGEGEGEGEEGEGEGEGEGEEGEGEGEGEGDGEGEEQPGDVCGNGIWTITEECDDSNITDGDGCSSSCTNESPCANVRAGLLNNSPAPGNRFEMSSTAEYTDTGLRARPAANSRSDFLSWTNNGDIVTRITATVQSPQDVVGTGLTYTLGATARTVTLFVQGNQIGLVDDLALEQRQVTTANQITMELAIEPSVDVFGGTNMRATFRSEFAVVASWLLPTTGVDAFHPSAMSLWVDPSVAAADALWTDLQVDFGACPPPPLPPAWGMDQPDNYGGVESCLIAFYDSYPGWTLHDYGCDLASDAVLCINTVTIVDGCTDLGGAAVCDGAQNATRALQRCGEMGGRLWQLGDDEAWLSHPSLVTKLLDRVDPNLMPGFFTHVFLAGSDLVTAGSWLWNNGVPLQDNQNDEIPTNP
jgi:cysteine-rich repeat protein